MNHQYFYLYVVHRLNFGLNFPLEFQYSIKINEINFTLFDLVKILSEENIAVCKC